jgi:hypothetical protein
MMYFEGIALDQNYEAAYSWFLKAAEQGFAMAQFNVGVLFQNGQGVIQDNRTAFTWFYKAAQQGLPNAQNSVGHHYADGIGVQQDVSMAATWFYKAASQGQSFSQFNLAAFLENGVGVQQDIDQAIYWYEKSAAQGNVEAVRALPKAIAKRDAQARLASYVAATGKRYVPVKSKGLNAVYGNAIPGSIVCKNSDTTDLMLRLYAQYEIDLSNQPFANSEREILAHGKPRTPIKPDPSAYGCILAKIGTPMYLEIGNVVLGVWVVVLIADDGSIYRGVTFPLTIQY